MEHIQLRASILINNPSTVNILPNINHQRNKRCAVEVFKCLNGLSACLFDNYFVKISHSKETRGNNKNLVLLRVRTEAGWKTFAFQGSAIFNLLPAEMKEQKSLLQFKNMCDTFDFDFGVN